MIRLERLSLSFGPRLILEDVSLQVHRGETLALIGESGGGKTSLARLLLGLIEGRRIDRPDCQSYLPTGFHWSGEAWIGDRNVLRSSPSQLRTFRGKEIGLIVQALSDALNPHLTVLQHMQELLKICGIPIAACDACLNHNIPTEIHHRFPSGLSGGEIQRVLTALALASRPRYLILDEPTASLDAASRERAIASFANGRDDRGQILITHDLDLARSLADSVGVLYQGRLVEIGKTTDLLDRPGHPYTRALMEIDRDIKRSTRLQFPVTLESRHRRGDNSSSLSNGVQGTALTQHKRLREGGVRISNLSHGYGGAAVLNGLSVFVPTGTCLAVLGESGCGKSTLARLLSGFEQVKSGTIEWCSTDHWVSPAIETANIHSNAMVCVPTSALISQHPHRAMARHFRVVDVLQEALTLGGDRCQRIQAARAEDKAEEVKSLLAEVGLPTDDCFLARRTPGLSGGEAQRLVIARALALKARYLIADEPTSALDIYARGQILALLKELKQKHSITLIICTHDTAAAEYLADHITQIEGGKLRTLSPLPEDQIAMNLTD